MTEQTTISIRLVIALAGPIFGMLLLGNIFFIKQIIEKINKSSMDISKLLYDMSNISQIFNSLERRQNDLMIDINHFKRIESRVSYLEGRMNLEPNGRAELHDT